MRKLISCLLALVVCFGCSNSPSDNNSLDYESIDISFHASCKGVAFEETDIVGVFASCTRDGVENTPMSEIVPCLYHPVSDGETANLIASGSWVSSTAGDHNFLFKAYFPYNESYTDMESIPASVPSFVSFTRDAPLKPLCVASSPAIRVVAPVDLDFRPLCCLADFRLADNIVNKEGGTVVRKMTVAPSPESGFNGFLAYNATYNFNTGELDIDESGKSNSVTVDFGEAGYALPSGFTDVKFLMAPFRVPEGGLEVTITDINGKNMVVNLFETSTGKEYKAGDTVSAMIKPEEYIDVVPCTSPVLWPVGYKDGEPQFSKSNQPLWVQTGALLPSEHQDHIWTAEQPLANIQFHFADDRPADFKLQFENNQFPQYNYASPCLKGLWTGDWFEFTIPVKDFTAGTEVTVTLPIYDRGCPVFWDLEYLDGTEWKCNRSEQESPDGQFTHACTFAFPHGNAEGSFEGCVVTHKMTFSKAIRSGYMKLRLKCADGTIIATNATTCQKVAKPNMGNPFAFVNKSGKCTALSVAW